MKKKIADIGILVVIILLCLIALMAGFKAWSKWKNNQNLPASDGLQVDTSWRPAAPTRETFDAVLREDLKSRGENFSRNTSRDNNDLCISMPDRLRADAESRSGQPLAWYKDFVESAPQTESRQESLLKLNALHKAGLLEKRQTTNLINDVNTVVTRYSLSEEGWAKSSGARGAECFVYAKKEFLGINGFTPVMVDRDAGLESYAVSFNTGVSAMDSLVPWARDAQMQGLFPEIIKSLKGQQENAILTRGAGKWTSLERLMGASNLSQSRLQGLQQASLSSEQRARLEQIERELAEQEKQPAPSVEEIKKLLQTNEAISANACLYLPGSVSSLPVDQSPAYGNSTGNYAVAIFTGKSRSDNDPVIKKSVPYLNQLEQIGVLRKRTEYVPVVRGRNSAGETVQAQVYELAPAYMNALDISRKGCLRLGTPTVQFIDVKVYTNTSGQSEYSYKVRVRYQSVPSWMQDVALQASWPELRGVMERGRACSGRFGFNRQTRTSQGGSESCWWAFDSMAGN